MYNIRGVKLVNKGLIYMQLRESTRRYILLGLIGLIMVGLIVSKVMASNQDEQFAKEDMLYQQASQLFSQGNSSEAAVYIDELLKLQPESEEVNYLGALISASNNKMEKSAILFQKTLDINPYKIEDPVFMLQFGSTLYSVERYEDAKIVLTRCKEAGWAPENYPDYQDRVNELLDSIENM